ncbi:unnamed protein product [Prunus brigantina]
MLFVDVCSMSLEFKYKYDKLEHFKIKREHVAFTQQDMFMLENQLAYKLLKASYGQLLYLPKIKVDDSTGPKFMNLIAYEMSSDFQSNFGDVTSYICFLHLLIHHVDDVKHLKEKFVEIGMSEEDVAQLFKERGIQFVPNNDIYRIVKTKIEDHCTTKWKT